MSDIKHKPTPGTWNYDRGIIPPDGPGRYSTVSADGDVVIAEVNDLISEGIANACLIVAAPDMLTALETVLAGGHLNTGEQAIVANAIAKATGKSIDEVLRVGG